MVKTLSVILALALVSLVCYSIFLKEPPLSQRDAIEDGVAQVRAQRDLSPAEEQLLKLQFALIDFTVKKTHPPDTLAELIPEYFDEMPINPATKKQFDYVRDGNKYRLGSQAIAAASEKKPEVQKSNAVTSPGDGFFNPNTFIEFDFVYDPTGKRDPFLQFDLTPKIALIGELSPLQRFSLGQLKLTAVLMDKAAEPKAIVEDSNGKGYTVVPGTLIGNSRGVVIGIEQDKVKVLETSVDFAGNERQNVSELKLNNSKDRALTR